MVNDQDNTNDEIGSIAHKDKANGQDNIKIMNSGNDTHVRDDEHGTGSTQGNSKVNGGKDDEKEKECTKISWKEVSIDQRGNLLKKRKER